MVDIMITADTMCCTQHSQKTDMASFPILTGSALIGLVNSIYGKPEFNWVVRRLKVLNKIKRVHMKVNGRNKDRSRSPFCGDFIKEVAYIATVEAVVPDYPGNIAERREGVYLPKKHEEILIRRMVNMEAGSKRGALFLGHHECHCTVSLAPEVEPRSYYEGKPPVVFRGIPFVQTFTPVPEEDIKRLGIGGKDWQGGWKVVRSPHDGKWYYANFHHTDLVMVNGVINFDPRLYMRYQTNCSHHSQTL